MGGNLRPREGAYPLRFTSIHFITGGQGLGVGVLTFSGYWRDEARHKAFLKKHL